VKLVDATKREKRMNIGYARVSTDDQHTENQIEQLEKAGCEKIYRETASGGRWDRPELQKCLNHLRRGDVLIVWQLDRLSRSLSDLLRILDKVNSEGVGFKSLTESIDTTTPAGRLMMNMLGSFNQFEREIIRERTKLGLARARANGRKGGGKHILSAKRQSEVIRQVTLGEKTQADAARDERVSKATISRLMKKAGAV
jgi:DNA invertase Pin-like site-specific DNA recombinase